MSFGSKSLPKPTPAESARISLAKHRGCIACRYDKANSESPIEYHHILVGGRRVGHRYGLALCAGHHRGVPPYAGVSLMDGSKRFHNRYGSDQTLLNAQDDLLMLPRVELPPAPPRKPYKRPSKILRRGW